MFTGKYHIGKPIISVSDGRRLGTLKDLYVDLELTQVVGVSLGSEGLFSRKELCVERSNVLVFGVDAILVKQDDVIVDGAPTCELGTWLRRDQLPGRQIATSGGTLVGTVDDIILDDSAVHMDRALRNTADYEGVWKHYAPITASSSSSSSRKTNIHITKILMTTHSAKLFQPSNDTVKASVAFIQTLDPNFHRRKIPPTITGSFVRSQTNENQ